MYPLFCLDLAASVRPDAKIPAESLGKAAFRGMKARRSWKMCFDVEISAKYCQKTRFNFIVYFTLYPQGYHTVHWVKVMALKMWVLGLEVSELGFWTYLSINAKKKLGRGLRADQRSATEKFLSRKILRNRHNFEKSRLSEEVHK